LHPSDDGLGSAAEKATKKPCRRCEFAKLGLEEPTETLPDYAEAVTLSEEPPKRIPVGTRIHVVLAAPVTTSTEGAPVTSEVTSDVSLEGLVLIPAGSRIEGLAFATEADDRARILFTGLVLNGQSVAIQGLGLSEASEVGLPAQLVRKASKGKRGGHLLLGALGAAAGVGLGSLGNAVTSAAGSEVGYGLSRELQTSTRDWAISDKALRVASRTTAIVYLRSEVTLP